MTPKERYLPLILAKVKPLLKDAGFRVKGGKFTLRVSDDVPMEIWLMIVREIRTGCLELRPTFSVYSHRFAQLGMLYEGPPDWSRAAIFIPLTRLKDRRDLRQWQICTEADAAFAADVISDQVRDCVQEWIPQLKTADQIYQILAQNSYLHIARPDVSERWCATFQRATGSPVVERPVDLEQRSRHQDLLNRLEQIMRDSPF